MCCFSLFRRSLSLVAFCLVLSGVFASHGVASVRSFSPSHAWDAKVVEHSALPPRVVAVDKKEQVLSLLEFQSSLDSTTTYLCSTGQAPGDKVVEGDLKTPEGVYFVVQHLKSGLDFDMYGYEAYTLNYPNPVDKIRRKTGYGIWVHGKGNGIAPLQTQGCIALNNNDLSTLGNKLTPGLPVIISNSVKLLTPASNKAQTIKELQGLSQKWAKAWENRSAEMFDFYNHEAYSIANEPFSAFKNNKERLFKRLPWIKTTIRDIQVLEGPGYWVTWFYQDYQAPNLTSKGVRRLYWSQSGGNDFKIIGMEWLPGMNTSAQLVREDPPMPPIDKAPKTETVPQKFDTITAEASSNETVALVTKAEPQNAEQVQGSLVATKEESQKAQPKKRVPELIASTTGGVIGATYSQTPLPERKQPAPEPVPEPAPELATKPQAEPEPTLLAESPTPPPLKETVTKTPSSKPGSQIAEPQSSSAKVHKKSEPKAASILPLSDNEVLALVEAWRNAWEKGNLKQYVAFYAKDAVQDRRTSRAAIENHKLALWKRAHPKSVGLTKIRVSRQGSTIIVTMQQQYASRNGSGDKGKKVLHIQYADGAWRIAKETWSSN